MRRIVLPADLARIDQVTQTLTEHAVGHLDPAKLDCLQIALAEALVNIARHGYHGEEGIIDVTFEVGPAVTVVLRDRGVPIPAAAFEPHPEPDEETIPDLDESGRGMALIQNCCDGIDYRTSPEGNFLTLVFRPTATQDAAL
jgi:serine/threonine-protein kinase RsbW